jgi:F420H(2)-dependent quinone reductase
VVGSIKAGRPARNPYWYYNLKAAPRAHIEVNGRAFEVLAEDLPVTEAAAAWSRIVQVLPDYARFRRFTDRTFPIVRLVGAATFA